MREYVAGTDTQQILFRGRTVTLGGILGDCELEIDEWSAIIFESQADPISVFRFIKLLIADDHDKFLAVARSSC